MTHELNGEVSWTEGLEVNKHGVPKDTIGNWLTVAGNDPFLGTLGFCTRGEYFVEGPEQYQLAEGPMPEVDPDRISIPGLRQYLKSEYRFSAFPAYRRSCILSEMVSERAFDPVKDYLEGLHWDGVSRLSTALPGSGGTAYDYELARKIFVVSANRVLNPGRYLQRLPIFHSDNEDSMRRWISLIGRGYTQYFSKYGKAVVKDASRSWIAVFDLSKYRTFDHVIDFWWFAKSREDYSQGRDRECHYRNWDVWAITSRPQLLEEDPGSGRRFSIKLPAEIDFDKYTPGYIDQLWAEAVHEEKEGYNDMLYIEDLKKPGGKLGYL